MSKIKALDTVAIIDDEIHNMLWMVDYLESKGFKVETATNVNEAVKIIDSKQYKAIIVDLQIPVLNPLIETVEKTGEIYKLFPGLYVAKHARNKGYSDRQVVIYSVHNDPTVEQEAKNLYCTYIIKGRPKDIKNELELLIGFSPITEKKDKGRKNSRR